MIESFAMSCGTCKVMIASYRMYILNHFSNVYHTSLDSNCEICSHGGKHFPAIIIFLKNYL